MSKITVFLVGSALALGGCTGEIAGTSDDAGAAESREAADAGQEFDAPAGMSGCYPDASLACGPVVGRWCWASPSTYQPAPACVPFHPEGGVIPTGYWCCP